MSDYDVVVIGAGIHGAGVAQAAAAAGYTVLVVEKTAVAAGTSSRSSKLIHGGLRYLESGQFVLVYKSLQERALLCRLAPELVELKPFYLPVYRTTQRRPWQIRLGLFLYAMLGGFRPENRFRTLPKGLWSQLDGLRQTDLQTVFEYRDAQTDDRQLTRAVMKSARNLGARLICPARVEAISALNERFVVTYQHGDSTANVSATVVVNASGPWANQVLAKVQPAARSLAVDLVQGTHLVLDVAAPAGIYYLEAADRRAVFVMPWHGKTLIGTTETLFTGTPDEVSPLDAEKEYLLRVYQTYFPTRGTVNVLQQFAGLRVLPRTDKRPFTRPRDTILHWGLPGLLTLYGGKLTAYRATAEAVIRKIRPLLPERRRIAHTDKLGLTAD